MLLELEDVVGYMRSSSGESDSFWMVNLQEWAKLLILILNWMM